MIRASLVRARIFRALAASVMLAGTLALAGCNTDDGGYQLPTRAMKELSPEMLTLLQQKNMPKDSPILVRLFKEESELEVWKQDTTGRFALLKVYPICRWSGELGPKVREGDRQAPEGFYTITPGLMNPNSSYYLAINTGFPNAYDKANDRHGAFLMIHGDCSSRGCYAMTDEQIGEIYSLARDSFLGGEKSFQIQAYPFRMTPVNLARHRTNPNMPFWRMLKEGNDHFLVSHLEPKVDVCDRRYVFDAQPPANNSTKPLVFNPTGRCPAFQVQQDIAGPAAEKERNDDAQIAQLTARNAPVAPIVMGTDGGMNRVFVAKLDQPTAVYDNEGHLHAPPVHPGMPLPTISAPRGSEPDDTTSSVASSGKSGFFSRLFASKKNTDTTNTDTTHVAAAEPEPQKHSSFFGNLFSSKKKDAPQEASPSTALRGSEGVAEKKKPATHNAATAVAGLRPKPKAEPEEAVAAKSKPQQEANAAAGAGLLKGAQPVMPAGSFDGRFDGM